MVGTNEKAAADSLSADSYNLAGDIRWRSSQRLHLC